MKIVLEEVLKGCGPFAASAEWKEARKRLHDAIRSVAWPPESKLFTIYPESGKKRDEGNGVQPIKDGLMSQLQLAGWVIEGQAANVRGEKLGKFDAVYSIQFWSLRFGMRDGQHFFKPSFHEQDVDAAF